MRLPLEHSKACCRAPLAPGPHSFGLDLTFHVSRFTSAFTLIELILVMAILTIAVSLTAPTLSHFFRGRTLDSEARRLLALTRHGQERAASEGVPMDLWLNASGGEFGLEAEPSYEPSDARAITLTVDSGVQLEVVNSGVARAAGQSQSQSHSSASVTSATVSVRKVTLAHPNLPTIRFLPDGSISESSPQTVRLTGREGAVLLVGQSRDRLSYEIRDNDR